MSTLFRLRDWNGTDDGAGSIDGRRRRRSTLGSQREGMHEEEVSESRSKRTKDPTRYVSSHFLLYRADPNRAQDELRAREKRMTSYEELESYMLEEETVW